LIEAGDGLRQDVHLPQFQSHAGSIEARQVIKTQLRRLLGFNPTLVRLRLPCPCQCSSEFWRFQSHAGSIEAMWKWGIGFGFPPVSIPRWFD